MLLTPSQGEIIITIVTPPTSSDPQKEHSQPRRKTIKQQKASNLLKGVIINSYGVRGIILVYLVCN
jgi:hypothetical protein